MKTKPRQWNKSKTPATLAEALLLGYVIGEDEEWEDEGGLVGRELRSGRMHLHHPIFYLPSLTLPYTAKLTFGKPCVDEKRTTTGALKRNVEK